ncbi:ribosomal-processing cysteine protease Prp [Ferdinandcohnia sp. SAFN-114]|uniref:ribosomal-processing cysteine protease Prp n=1 Tax=Ferdinandcohnia sp. SAFN-114 TaxID=3387275 RepID=UPI003F7F277E
MIYKFCDSHVDVVFSEKVVKVFQSYKQIEKNQHESGGILLGKIYKDLILIDTISEPSEEDKSGRYYFYRNVQKAQRIIEDAWDKSKGERIYLGEWHTHPEDIPTPSSDDKKLLSCMLKDSTMEIDFLLMTIIGIKNSYVAIQRKGQKEIQRLRRIKATDGLEITLYENQQGKINGFKVGGYLQFAKLGYDIYNAVFSQIFFGTINSIVALTGISDYILEKEKAFIRFVIPSINENEEKAFILFDSMKIQIEMVMEEMQGKNLDNRLNIRIDNATYKEYNKR